MKALLLTPILLFSLNSFADENPSPSGLPTDEKAFVKAITNYKKAEIVAQLGEPAKKQDFTSEETGEVLASIWEYNTINTDENGKYYASTELDFVGEKVDVVVFMNDNSDKKIENIEPMENSVVELPMIRE